MIATFIRIWAPDDLRLGMAISTVARWQKDSLADLTLIICSSSLFHDSWANIDRVMLAEDNFSQQSIKLADEMAYGDYYSVSDDDMLIYGKDFLLRCKAVLERNPEYGIICASPANEHISSESGDGREVIESHAVGGSGLIRKGIMKDFPAISNQEYSGWIDKQYRSKGYKMGYMRDVKYLHLGAHFSFSSPAHCDGY
jgi:hypothetical protein